MKIPAHCPWRDGTQKDLVVAGFLIAKSIPELGKFVLSQLNQEQSCQLKDLPGGDRKVRKKIPAAPLRSLWHPVSIGINEGNNVIHILAPKTVIAEDRFEIRSDCSCL
jgi:hypothetical protein